MAFPAYLFACACEVFDGSNNAVRAYLDALDRNDQECTEIEHQNCLVVYRKSSIYTSAKLACKLSSDGALLRYCRVEYFPAAMNAIGDFVIQSWYLVYAAATDPKQYKHLLDVLMARLNSVSSNIQLAANAMYNSLQEFIKDLKKKFNMNVGVSTFFASIVGYIKTNWWLLAQSVSQYVSDAMRVHFYKYVFQITAVMTELNERLAAMAGELCGPNNGQNGEILLGC